MRIIAMMLGFIFVIMPYTAFGEENPCVHRALLIGVHDFATYEDSPQFIDQNLEELALALQGGTTTFDCILFPDSPIVSKQGLQTWLANAFADADANDMNYLYISTHGKYTESGDAILLFSDGITEYGLTADVLEALLSEIKGTMVVVLDACYSGAFIGKGMQTQPKQLYFRNGNCKVLTSSGAKEESWYWNGESKKTEGTFYFTRMLTQGISAKWNYPADENRDGDVTILELYRYVLNNHGASTPQLYPQEDDTVVFSYDPTVSSTVEKSPIVDVVFSDDVISENDRLTLSYTAIRPVRVAYQIVYFRDGEWQFQEAELLYDEAERYTAFGDLAGAVMPGRKVREISITQDRENAYGYVLVQVLSLEDDVLTMQAGHVITVTPRAGNLLLSVQTPGEFTAGEGEELPIFIQHSLPCALNVTITDATGTLVRRLMYHASTRPLGIVPEGTCLYWNGRDKNDILVSDGQYYAYVEAWIGESVFSATSRPIIITQ